MSRKKAIDDYCKESFYKSSVTRRKEKESEFTQDDVKSRFSFDEKRGVLIHRINYASAKKGDIAGTAFTDWSGKKYRKHKIDGVQWHAHRLIWLYVHGSFPKNEIDHIDGDGMNNVLSNLREVTRAGNCRNIKKYKKRSMCNGVQFYGGIFNAKIGRKGKTLYLGGGKDYFEICCLRKSAENKYGYHKNHGQ